MATVVDISQWIALAVGMGVLGLSASPRLTARNPQPVPLRVALPICAALTITLAAAAPAGRIPFSVGLIAMNVAWMVIVVRLVSQPDRWAATLTWSTPPGGKSRRRVRQAGPQGCCWQASSGSPGEAK
ncbi:MAG: hypothetical protein C0P76_014770 [Acidimicrobiia bacterium]